MLTDVLIVGLAIGLATWGYFRGVSPDALAVLGFALGAVLGAWLAPQILDRGLDDPLAPALAVPGGLMLGGALAAGFERLGIELARRWLRRRPAAAAAGGGAVGVLLAVVAVWILGAIGVRVDALERTVRDSEIIDGLNAVVTPPGLPLVGHDRNYPLPRVRGPRTRLRPADARLKLDPQVRAAARSVVKVRISACGRRAVGSGWIAEDGVVATNAHVAEGGARLEVQVGGGGLRHDATTVLYDVRHDIAILRTPGTRGARPLDMAGVPRPNSSAVVLGFPRGRRYKARQARIGPTRPLLITSSEEAVTQLRATPGVEPGSSGGPLVDGRGRVVGMIFARNLADDGRTQFAVPTRFIRRALKRAASAGAAAVDTGDCEDE